MTAVLENTPTPPNSRKQVKKHYLLLTLDSMLPFEQQYNQVNKKPEPTEREIRAKQKRDAKLGKPPTPPTPLPYRELKIHKYNLFDSLESLIDFLTISTMEEGTYIKVEETIRLDKAYLLLQGYTTENEPTDNYPFGYLLAIKNDKPTEKGLIEILDISVKGREHMPEMLYNYFVSPAPLDTFHKLLTQINIEIHNA